MLLTHYRDVTNVLRVAFEASEPCDSEGRFILDADAVLDLEAKQISVLPVMPDGWYDGGPLMLARQLLSGSDWRCVGSRRWSNVSATTKAWVWNHASSVEVDEFLVRCMPPALTEEFVGSSLLRGVVADGSVSDSVRAVLGNLFEAATRSPGSESSVSLLAEVERVSSHAMSVDVAVGEWVVPRAGVDFKRVELQEKRFMVYDSMLASSAFMSFLKSFDIADLGVYHSSRPVPPFVPKALAASLVGCDDDALIACWAPFGQLSAAFLAADRPDLTSKIVDFFTDGWLRELFFDTLWSILLVRDVSVEVWLAVVSASLVNVQAPFGTVPPPEVFVKLFGSREAFRAACDLSEGIGSNVTYAELAAMVRAVFA